MECRQDPEHLGYRRQFIWQIQVAKRVDVLPITRDYIKDGERAMAKPAARVA